MAIEYIDGDDRRTAVLTECPICGKKFKRQPGADRANHFADDHTPEDFGL